MINIINEIITELVDKYKLPSDGLCLIENKGAKSTTYTFVINEQPFPVINKNVVSRSMIILNFVPVKAGITEVIIKNKMVDIFPYPSTMTLKEVKSDKINHHLLMINDDKNGKEYIKNIAEYCLSIYESSSTFGCCSKYNECSKVKECVHENKLYSTGCMYRKKLEKNIIYFNGE